MSLPLPRVVADVGPGGGLVTALGGINTLAHNMLKRKYYAPDIESQINGRNALTEGQKIQNQYMPDKLRLANAFAQLQNDYYGSNIQSEINQRNALTQKYNAMTPLEAKALELKNKYYPRVTESDINAQTAIANLRKSGGPTIGVAQKELVGFQNQLANDHPEWTNEEVNQAASAYLTGDNMLPNGTQLPPPSGLAKTYLNNIAKRGTTAALVTSGVKSEQADAELKVLNDFANKGLQSYGTTYFGYSPKQIIDTFKSDSTSQKKLGRFIASQALQYEAAQNRIRLAAGQPGVTATEELMKLAQQSISTFYPKLSGEARKEVTRYMDEALEKGLRARQSVETGASSLIRKNNKKNVTPKIIDTNKYDIPEGYIGLTKDGKDYFFPPNIVEQKLTEGYSYE